MKTARLWENEWQFKKSMGDCLNQSVAGGHPKPSYFRAMKKTLSIVMATLTFQVASFAQPSDSNKFAQLSVGKAERLIDKSYDVEVRRSFIKQAIISGREDLIRLCFTNQYTFRDTVGAIGESKDDKFKAQAVIMMLRTPSFFWPKEDLLLKGSLIKEDLEVEPFVSVIHQKLPEVKAIETELLTRRKREKLAADLEKAAGQTSSMQPKQPGK